MISLTSIAKNNDIHEHKNDLVYRFKYLRTTMFISTMTTSKWLYLLKEKITISDAIFFRVHLLTLAKIFTYAQNFSNIPFVKRIEPTNANKFLKKTQLTF